MLLEIWHYLIGYLNSVFITSFDGWVMIGYVGQTLFILRFGVQWYASEREGRSIIPLSFWYLSIGGAVLLCVYAIYLRNPVFILGQGPNVFIYIRNLMLIARVKKRIRASQGPH
jgi:lipid-A-disaccharide synthase-like uncharacterized protein